MRRLAPVRRERRPRRASFSRIISSGLFNSSPRWSIGGEWIGVYGDNCAELQISALDAMGDRRDAAIFENGMRRGDCNVSPFGHTLNSKVANGG